MASVLTHGLWTGALVHGQPVPRRTKVAAMALACFADIDFVLAPFSQSPDDLLAHRGVLHSPLFAIAAGLLVALAISRDRRSALILALAALGHPLLDAVTWGGHGIAWLAPFSTWRALLPPRLIPVVPLGLPEYLSTLGLVTIAAEALFILVPTLLLLNARERDRRWYAAAGLWLVIAVSLRAAGPLGFSPPPPRVVTPIPTSEEEGLDALPKDLALVTNFDELRAKGLFDKPLTPREVPWSSGFFPYWFGGHAGRWKDSVPTLLGRTLFGAEASAEPVERLSPTEKYDLVRGDKSFSVSRATLSLTHNARPRPRFWFGLCNGVAGASLNRPEPYRTVEVKSASGEVVRFHPNDIKALLAAAWFRPADVAQLGDSCRVKAFDAARKCEAHPAAFVLAVLNGVGIAQRSFVVDVYPTPQAQYFAVANAKVRIARDRYGEGLVDVVVELELASTLVSSSAADIEVSPGQYARVGVRPVHARYPVTLQLDAAGNIAGGRYDDVDGPDQLQFIAPAPDLTEDGHLVAFPELKWSAIDALAKASASDEPQLVDVSVF